MSAPDNLKDVIRRANCDAPDAMRRRLWRDVATGLHQSQAAERTGGSFPAWRVAMNSKIAKLAVAALIGVGGITAVVVGVNVGQYYFEGKQADGTYRFRSEQTTDGGTYRDANGVEQPLITRRTTSVVVGPDSPDGTLDVERTRKDLAEIDRLRQQDIRELKGVVETEVNGDRERRILYYSYTLADGRTILRNDLDSDDRDRKTVLTTEQWKELGQLRDAGPGEDCGTEEKEVKGRTFTFQRQRFLLGDGTEVIWSKGTPKDNQ